jgi:hypothetical protein
MTMSANILELFRETLGGSYDPEKWNYRLSKPSSVPKRLRENWRQAADETLNLNGEDFIILRREK